MCPKTPYGMIVLDLTTQISKRYMSYLPLRVRLARIVDPLVESAEDDLSEVEAARVGLARGHQFREEIRGDR